jgi:hypothetical protein
MKIGVLFFSEVEDELVFKGIFLDTPFEVDRLTSFTYVTS